MEQEYKKMTDDIKKLKRSIDMELIYFQQELYDTYTSLYEFAIERFDDRGLIKDGIDQLLNMKDRLEFMKDKLEFKREFIPNFVFKNHIEQEKSKNVECPITCVPLKECKNLSVLSCFHIYETDVIKKARETSLKCPLCREIVSILYSS